MNVKVYEQASCSTIGPFYLMPAKLINGCNCSFVVNSKHNASAEEWMIWKSEVCIVVVHNVPETFASYTYALTLHFSNNCLDHDFVGRNGVRFESCSDLITDVFSPNFSLHMIIFLAFEISLDNIFDNGSYFARIESN